MLNGQPKIAVKIRESGEMVSRFQQTLKNEINSYMVFKEDKKKMIPAVLAIGPGKVKSSCARNR